MYATSAITLAISLLASTGMAAPTAAAEKSTPTKYYVETVGKSGTHKTAACHAGAAIEALCVYPENVSEFTFESVKAGTLDPIYLTINASETGFQVQKMSFMFEGNKTDNVRPAYFGGSSNPPVKLHYDASSTQLSVAVNSTSNQANWYLCPYSNLGYTYNTVSWVKDFAKPTDSQCEKITLKRVKI